MPARYTFGVALEPPCKLLPLEEAACSQITQLAGFVAMLRQAAQYWALLLPNWPLREDFCQWAMRRPTSLQQSCISSASEATMVFRIGAEHVDRQYAPVSTAFSARHMKGKAINRDLWMMILKLAMEAWLPQLTPFHGRIVLFGLLQIE